ncbi:hypothetical protein [Alkalilimnicola sp. S0819]|uniref:hypothetical protein n=1 Tax=Alkalilimnicola sp. S0819 TaxID=2613922 RepID=UPI00126246BC|nr:hypothetical protein [Alkalilimnicola sp. S0819]KAB7628419.1 hypothetical protein F3N43_01600 [Alkalilimnicola sp. S0819]MPQ15322.1 hypothetical protein [Alkalilimnicola sp. S0819]
MTQNERARSVARDRPLEAVKRELGVVLLAGLCLLFLLMILGLPLGRQLFVLLAYSVFATLWLVLRTRRLARGRAQGVRDAP